MDGEEAIRAPGRVESRFFGAFRNKKKLTNFTLMDHVKAPNPTHKACPQN